MLARALPAGEVVGGEGDVGRIDRVERPVELMTLVLPKAEKAIPRKISVS
jgi:hypothetical protein